MGERGIVMLHRRVDPSHEYREIILRANGLGMGQWIVWQAFGSLSKADASFSSHQQLFYGSEKDAREFFANTILRSRGEDLVECVPDDVRAWCSRDEREGAPRLAARLGSGERDKT
jgi:hypothetical protein